MRRKGLKTAHGPVFLTHLPADADAGPPRLACSVNRKAGGAVRRNQVRRRLRAIFRDMAGRDLVPGGAYLVAVDRQGVDLPYQELMFHVEHAMRAIDRKRAA